MKILRHLLAAIWLCLLAGQGQAAQVVWLALSGEGGPYGEIVEAVRANVQRDGAQIELVARPWQELVRVEGPPPRLVVTVGVAALRAFVDYGPRVPLLATLVPRTAYAKIAGAQAGRPQSAVWLDQPAGRQFDLLRLAQPSRQRVAVIFGPDSRIQEEEVLRAAAERKLNVVVAHSDGSERLSATLQSVLEDADVLLALPDPQIYNGATVAHVLMSTYRHRTPVMAFSSAFATAGALLALYSTPEQVGTQVGEIVRATLAGRPLPPPQGPRDFTVGFNADVARSLGINLDAATAERWAEQLRGKERTP
jgi:ABC-type uncharacterized transport system substrate-binding protein